jgi:GGDEF domain-containing protein
MNEKPIFVIGEQHAGRDIFNIARDLNVNQNSPAEDILKIIEAIQHKVGELDIVEKDKKRIANQIEGAKIELEDEQPDKKLIAESIKKTTEILKEAKTTGETLKDIGVLVGNAAAWLGTTAAKLGWMF